jgi:hypothetical protein
MATDALDEAALLDPMASPVSSSPRADRGASGGPPSRADAVAAAYEATVLPRRRRPASPGDGLAADEEPAPLVRPRVGLETPGAPRPAEAAPDSPSSHDAVREQRPPREPMAWPSPRAVSVPASAWLVPARPAAGAPAAPRVHEREPRITIGRIDVEVHNEPPPTSPTGTARPVATSAPRPRLASRFLLKP